jgi:hypothetical protein
MEAVIFAEPAVRLGNILALWLSMMINDADRDRIRELCSLIAVEQDRHKLLQLIEELSRHIGAKDEGLKVKQIGLKKTSFLAEFHPPSSVSASLRTQLTSSQLS